jgi:rhamnulose-1-phosphate aldolase/alcohol dehydrogenase
MTTKNPLLQAVELQELITRTRKIGADTSLVVFGGGNTSSKGNVVMEDGSTKRVMWIKASGGDMATATERTFAPLDLDVLDSLRQYDNLTDEKMVELVTKALLDPTAPRPSIETLLHGFMPAKHIDHVHADAICALTNHANGRVATREALGDEWAYVEWMRSGFPLSQVVAKLGEYRGVVLAHHGVITWAETSEECLAETERVVGLAQAYLDAKDKSGAAAKKEDVDAATALTATRKHFSTHAPKVLYLDTRFRAIADREDLAEVVSAGVSSADHMLRIRPRSIVLDSLEEQLVEGAFGEYAAEYAKYTERNKDHLPGGFDFLDAVPRVALVPGLGAITAAETLKEAKMYAEIAFHTHSVAAKVKDCFGQVEALSDLETFRFEYWPMELYKLTLKPKPRKLTGQIFVVTGAGSGIGRGIALHLAGLGANLVLADLNAESLTEVSAQVSELSGTEPATVVGDQSLESVTKASVAAAIHGFGGLDGIVSNAGIAVTGPLDELALESWNKAMAVNLTSSFLLTQGAIQHLKAQGMGGSLVYVASKNAFAPGAGFGAYSVTKAGMIQLMRMAAIEGGEFGIRSNAVSPDAVFDNSKLWDGGIREDRAAAHGITPDKLEDFYSKRNILKRQVRTTDVASTVEFLISDDSSRTTGAVIPVDGGVVGGFPR